MRRISILGSTGSIGTQALDVLTRLPGEFQLVAITARTNVELLAQQARTWGVEEVAIADENCRADLKNLLKGTSIQVRAGVQAVQAIAARDDLDLCLNALVGGAGMAPTVAALTAGVDVALSNKESLVMAGALINEIISKNEVAVYPVDSEHSAIWQCLAGERSSEVRRLILTGSGGPFRTLPAAEFVNITKAEALQHPNWDMGAKITIDSATMMNKGLEVIEARWLFDVSPDQVDIVVHPQSIIHSMVEFADGSVKAQLGVPDMRIPIQYALTYPAHAPANWEALDLVSIGKLTFEPPDMEKFPCIGLAYEALRRGGSTSAVLNLANDLAVAAFLSERIRFIHIPQILERTMDAHPFVEDPSLDSLAELGVWTSEFVSNVIENDLVQGANFGNAKTVKKNR